MATKIRRCLYIGLGGTGMTSLLHTKKMFVETYGEVPPMIGFLGIDTNGTEYNKELDSKYGKIKLTPNEMLPITVSDAKPIYNKNKEHFSYIPECNTFALSSMVDGAGQVRTNGRFALAVNYQKVEDKIHMCLANIANANITDNTRYDLLGPQIEIHMVFSLCGGTGSGTFIDMAYLVKRIAPNSKLTGYAVLADVFPIMSTSGMAKVKPNAYGAIQDLDRLMHFGLGNNDKIQLDYITKDYIADSRPFNAVFFVDNTNSNGDRYTHVDQLSEMISLALVTSSGELSNAAASVTDNVEKNIAEGDMDIKDKKAWAAGLGVCELVFKGTELSRMCALKVTKRIIERLFNACADVNTIANNWIDSPEVKIRENGGSAHDDVIDFILPKNPSNQMNGVNDKQNALQEANQYVEASLPKPEELSKKIAELKNRVEFELRKLMVKHLNQECGIGATEGILCELQAQLDVFISEMKNEIDDLRNKKQPQLKAAVEVAAKDLSEYAAKFIKALSGIEERESDLSNVAMQLAVCCREIMRHDAAITFFNAFQIMLNDEKQHIANIKSMLTTINKELTDDIAKIQNNSNGGYKSFQIDLAASMVSEITVDDDDFDIVDFVRFIKYNDKIYDFTNQRNSEVKELMINYADSLRTSRKWANKSIDDVINDIDEEELSDKMRRALTKALPLFTYTYRGEVPAENPADNYYIGVYDKQTSRLNRDNYLKNLSVGAANMDFASIGVKDRIIIYRQIGVVPAYAITPVTTYDEKYKELPERYHFDINFKTRMERENYSLFPKATVDNTLDLWVYGFLFGMIKNEDGKYYVKDDDGDPIDDFWTELSAYRDEAFNFFRTRKSSLEPQFEKYFNELKNSKGEDYIQQIIADAKEAPNYWKKYSQINMSREDIKAHGNESIKALFDKELRFVKDMK